jgi:DNA-binding NtrC family response regulator
MDPMVDFRVAMRTTLLLVDDGIQQLEMRALALNMAGFTVLTAGGPVQAISIMAQDHRRRVDVAVLDYDMPAMNGCVLAHYLRARYPRLKIILYSGAVDVPEAELSSVDAFVHKGEGVARLLEEVSVLAQLTTASGTAMISPDTQLCPLPTAS